MARRIPAYRLLGAFCAAAVVATGATVAGVAVAAPPAATDDAAPTTCGLDGTCRTSPPGPPPSVPAGTAPQDAPGAAATIGSAVA